MNLSGLNRMLVLCSTFAVLGTLGLVLLCSMLSPVLKLDVLGTM